MLSFEPNKRYLREPFPLEKSAAKAHRFRAEAYDEAALIVSGFINLRPVNLTSKTENVAEGRLSTKTWKWKHYWRIRAKRKKSKLICISWSQLVSYISIITKAFYHEASFRRGIGMLRENGEKYWIAKDNTLKKT